MVNQDDARRVQNKHNAMLLARSGIPVFPSSGKVPLVRAFQKLDTQFNAEERAAEIEKAREEGNKTPTIWVGATCDPAIANRMWRGANRDAVPSVSCGPARLVVIDADTKDDGPRKIAALFEANGGVPRGCIIITSQSGGKHYIFRDPESRFTNRAGMLKKQYGCDVRGKGGQFVAPGSVREDGKRYGAADDLKAFVAAYVDGTLPELPEHIVDLIGQSPESETSVLTESETAPIVRDLAGADVVEWEDLIAPLGEYDFDSLLASDSDLKELYDNPTGDCSTNRFRAAISVMTEWPNMPPEHLAAFFLSWGGAGEFVDHKPTSGQYDNRQIAREWLKNQGKSKRSTGDSFAEVLVDDAIDDKEAFLANGGTNESWSGWLERLGREREERLARAERQRLSADAPEAAQADSERGKFAYIEDIRKAEPRNLDWCVKFFIARGTTSIVSGLWGAGKTAVFTDIALHIAHGIPYRDRKVKKGVVLYVALENPEDVERRVRAWCETLERAGHDVSGGAFVIHRGPCCLFRPDGKQTADEKGLIKIAENAQEHYGLPVGMIIIDTLSQSITPGNDREHGGIFVNAMQRISVATGANVTSLHHPTKAGEAVRGDGQLQGNVDTVIEVSRDKKTGRGTIEAGSKFRIGDPSKVRFNYRLKPVEIGRDEDGDIIDVVLATEDHDPSLEVIDTGDEEAPPLKVADRKEDRLEMLLAQARELAEKAAAEEQPLSDVALPLGELRAAFNARRRQFCGLDGQPLTELNRTGVKRVMDQALEDGHLSERRGRFFLTK